MGQYVRDLERCANLAPSRRRHRADARRPVLQRAPPRMPELQDPRRRASRLAEHDRVGQGRSVARRGSSRSTGACTTTSTSTGLATSARALTAEGDRGAQLHLVLRRSAASSPAATAARRPASRSRRSTRRCRPAGCSIAWWPVSGRVQRVYLYHWSATTAHDTWDSALDQSRVARRARRWPCSSASSRTATPVVCSGGTGFACRRSPNPLRSVCRRSRPTSARRHRACRERPTSSPRDRVFFGGVIGALARTGLVDLVATAARPLAVGDFAVNVAGAALIGWLAPLMRRQPPRYRDTGSGAPASAVR